jgi:hypothetical protein
MDLAFKEYSAGNAVEALVLFNSIRPSTALSKFNCGMLLMMSQNIDHAVYNTNLDKSVQHFFKKRSQLHPSFVAARNLPLLSAKL